MDTELNPIKNETEVAESSKQISENGYDDNDKPKVIDDDITEPHQLDDVEETGRITESKNDQKHGDAGSSPTKSSNDDVPSTQSASETEPYEEIDSENLSENNSPEKNLIATITAAETAATAPAPATEEALPKDDFLPPSMADVDESVNDKNWSQINENSLEQRGSDMACLIPSPSDPITDSVDEKSWSELNEDPMDEANSEDSMDDEDGSNPKVAEQKSNNSECPVFELTDDNSSVDDTRSDGDGDGDCDDDIEDVSEEEDEDEEDEDDDEQQSEQSGNEILH